MASNAQAVSSSSSPRLTPRGYLQVHEGAGSHLLLVKEAAQEASARNWENELIEEKTIVSETKGEKGWQWDGEESRCDRRKEESKRGWGIKVS